MPKPTNMIKYSLPVSLSMLCSVSLSGQARAQEGDAHTIAFTKQINVSQLDPALSPQRLDEWVQTLAGPKATVTWEVNDCGEQTEPLLTWNGTCRPASRQKPASRITAR